MTPNEAAVRSKARAVLAEGVKDAVPVILDVEHHYLGGGELISYSV
jgi:hypothetical protein